MNKFKDLEGRNLELASRHTIPDFVKECFDVDHLTTFEYGLSFVDGKDTRVITKIIYDSVEETFVLSVWSWNYHNSSAGTTGFVSLSNTVAELMFEEHMAKAESEVEVPKGEELFSTSFTYIELSDGRVGYVEDPGNAQFVEDLKRNGLTYAVTTASAYNRYMILNRLSPEQVYYQVMNGKKRFDVY